MRVCRLFSFSCCSSFVLSKSVSACVCCVLLREVQSGLLYTRLRSPRGVIDPPYFHISVGFLLSLLHPCLAPAHIHINHPLSLSFLKLSVRVLFVVSEVPPSYSTLVLCAAELCSVFCRVRRTHTLFSLSLVPLSIPPSIVSFPVRAIIRLYLYSTLF